MGVYPSGPRTYLAALISEGQQWSPSSTGPIATNVVVSFLQASLSGSASLSLCRFNRPGDCQKEVVPTYLPNDHCNHNGWCEWVFGENRATCPDDCSAVCGDGICMAPSETAESCPQDCAVAAAAEVPVCGDGVCQGVENCVTCPDDCAMAWGKTMFCCGGGKNGKGCSNYICNYRDSECIA